MKHYDIIFVVLVYKNTDVLMDFFKNLHVKNSHVIIVNSFYDDNSLYKCRRISDDNGADFIPIENKGYGYGNNIGIKYVIDHYSFKYIAVSNSDVIIKEISALDTFPSGRAIIAPETRMLTGKRQNPDTPWKLPFLFGITNIALKNDLKWLYSLTHIYTRLSREIFFLLNRVFEKNITPIFSAHGSFFIVTEEAIKTLNPLFNDQMFLYNEEWFLAMKARLNKVPIFYCPQIKVLHLEGASSDTSINVGFKYNKQSFAILYEWIKNNEK